MLNKGGVLQNRAMLDKFCYKRFSAWNTEDNWFINPNVTTEDGNDGTTFPETIPSILLHASWQTGHGVWSQVESAERRLEPFQRKRYADGYAGRLKNWIWWEWFPWKETDEQPNVQVYSLTIGKPIGHPTMVWVAWSNAAPSWNTLYRTTAVSRSQA